MKKLTIFTILFCIAACRIHVRDDKGIIELKKADTLLVEKRYEESLSLYKSVYEKDSLNLLAIYGCGLTSLKSGNNLQAKYFFDKYLSRKQDANAFFYRGVSYDNLDNPQQAISDYSLAIALDSNNIIAYNNRGRLEANLKMYDEGMKDLTAALKIDSNQPECYDNIGLIYSDIGNDSEAIKYFSKAILLDPNIGICYFNRGVCYIELKQYKKAIDDLNIAIALEPTNGLFYKNRAIAYYNLKDMDETCEDLNKAVQFNDSSSKEYLDKFCNKRDKEHKTV